MKRDPAMTSEAVSRPARFSAFEWTLLVLLFCVPAIIGMARHPFWIDETLTIFPTPLESSSFQSFVLNFLNFSGSIRYTPLYAVLVGAWARNAPATELGLRCLNLPFLIGTALVSKAFISRLPLRSKTTQWLALTSIALSPFYIYYSFDLRPYASLICYGGMILLGLLLLEEYEARGPWLISFGFCLAFLTQPLVIVLAPVIALGVLWLSWRDPSKSFRLWIAPGIVGIVVTAATGLLYKFVRQSGGLEGWGGGGFFKNIVFIGYEFAGFAGLGPTRAQLRTLAPPVGNESTVAALELSWLDWLPAIVFAVAWVIALIAVVRALWALRAMQWWIAPTVRWPAVLFFGGIVLLTAFFYLFQHRFLSRHISFLYLPFACFLIACAAHVDAHARGRWLAVVLVLGFAASSTQLLFNPRHMREDPRGMIAAWRAVERVNSTVPLWAFYPAQSMIYYGSDQLSSLRGNSVYHCKRTGPASYHEIQMPGLSSIDLDGSRIITIEKPSREIWQSFLESNRGRRVVIGINRGTEFDREGFARQLLADPAAHAVKLGDRPFVECFECVIPGAEI